MAANNFNETVTSLFNGMNGLVSSKTVVGDAITVGDTILLPLVDVSFGVGAGAFAQDRKDNGMGGMGGKIQPTAVLVIQNGATRMISVKNQDVATKIVDMIPDLLEKVKSKKQEPDVDLEGMLDEAAAAKKEKEA